MGQNMRSDGAQTILAVYTKRANTYASSLLH